jgi:hypothetical protein
MPATGTKGSYYGAKKSKSGSTRAGHARGARPTGTRNAAYIHHSKTKK